MKLKLTNGKYTLIDKKFYDKVKNYKWRQDSLAGHVVITIGKKGHRKLLRLHRLIINVKDGELVDHINGNVLDNRLKNLRLANKSKNAMNRGKQRNNTSGYKGVSFNKQMNMWQAQLVANKIKRLNSFFKTKKEAAIAYNNAAIKFHKEFARLNNI